MTLLQAVILAIVQGATELFPVSSLGHAVLIPALLHWRIDEHDPLFLPYLTLLHLGTLLALMLFFWRDWWALIAGCLGVHGVQRQMDSIRIVALLVVATVPVVLVGAALEHKLRRVFGAPDAAACFLMINGLLLLVVEWRRRQQGLRPTRAIAAMSFVDAVAIGVWQCLALLPGISRSGATINGGLRHGLDHETATRFSLLMAQPVILAASVREAFTLRHTPPTHDQITLGLIGCVIAAVTALLSTAFLLRFMRNHDQWALTPFGLYCLAAGVGSLVLLHI
jgi:undecaprenyl-diphosphatase